MDDDPWLIYADWLEERGDARAEFLRLRLATKYLTVDHACRPMIDRRLSELVKDLDKAWLGAVLPHEMEVHGRSCWCYDESGSLRNQSSPRLHNEGQDFRSAGWSRIVESVDQTRQDDRREFAPLRDMSTDEREQVTTLPDSIATLKRVHSLQLYGSNLTHIPVAIGEMKNLEKFVPYTSYRLHWFPYEITRCENLHDSTVSTRAIYGNFKNRAPFPLLVPWRQRAKDSKGFMDLYESSWAEFAGRKCSVCDREFMDEQDHRVWISCRVATDVLPLLVNACSQSCIESLPAGARHHVRRPHLGGPDVDQPASMW